MELALINENDPLNEDLVLGMRLVVVSVNRETGEVVLDTEWDRFE